MAAWITKPWIEQALQCENVSNLPKLARAQILEFLQPSKSTDEGVSTEQIGFISDKKHYVKAVFSLSSVEQFKRENPNLELHKIKGGLIFIKKYSVEARVDGDVDTVEFVIKIHEFKFAGGEGNTQFGSDIIDSNSYAPIKERLFKLRRWSKVKMLLNEVNPSISGGTSVEKCTTNVELALLRNHDEVFIPENMERKLAEIEEWKPSYCPTSSCKLEREETLPDSRSSPSGLQQAEQVEPVTSSADAPAPANIDCIEQRSDSISLVDQSQDSPTTTQPLEGLHFGIFSSSSGSSQQKGSSEESYSVLRGRSPDVVSCSASSEDTANIVTPLPNVFSCRTSDQPYRCSLSESQLETLMEGEVTVSGDAVFSPPGSQYEGNSCKEGFTSVKSKTDRGVTPTSYCDDNTNSPSQYESSSSWWKRKRSQGNFQTCETPKQRRCVSPGSSSVPARTVTQTVSQTACSQSQYCSDRPSLYLSQPTEFYSQQDPLVLDESDVGESVADAIDGESSLLLQECQNQETVSTQNETAASLDLSMDECLTIDTPRFDSLPSYQIPRAQAQDSPSKGSCLSPTGQASGDSCPGPVCGTPYNQWRRPEEEPSNLKGFVHEHWRNIRRKANRKHFDWFT